MTKPEFDPKITLGNLITIAGAIVAIFASYYSLKANSESNSQRIERAEYSIKEFERITVRKDVFNEFQKQINTMENQVNSMNLKLDQILILNTKHK
jgi:predicted esterase